MNFRQGSTLGAPPLTHSFSLDQIQEGYSVFGERREGVLKVAIRP